MSDESIGEREHILVSCIEALERGDLAAIDQACSEHPELEDQIRSTADVVRVLETEAARHRRSVTREPAPMPNVDRFLVLREIGRGGTGIVYLAQDRRLGRNVALKTLPASVAASPEGLERFGRETRALARIRHPHIASIHDVGETNDGFPYFTMDHVEGTSLDAMLKRLLGKDPASLRACDLSPDGASTGSAGAPSYSMAVVRLAAKIADALHHAHEAGVVHRDVKPGNVLVNGAGEPFVVDFGIARVADSATLTRLGSMPGTPAYMAPELVSEGRVSSDRRVDVYGLGVTLYHCLTLRPPFDGESTEQVFEQIRHREPLALRRANPEVPLDLEAVVHKAIDKNPARRYATAAAFRDDLQALLELRPVLARPPGPLTKTVRWVRHRRGRAALIAVGALGIGFVAERYFAYDAAVSDGQRALARYEGMKHDLERAAERYPRDAARLVIPPDEARSGALADDAERLAQRTFEAERALATAEESFDIALRLGSWFPPLAASVTRQLADVRRIRRGESLVAGSVTFVVDAPYAEFHLFRFEEYRTRRPHTIPRLVPVPIDLAGTPVEFQTDELQPGDRCLVVRALEPDGPLARAGLEPGDLIYRIGAHGAGRGVFVRHVAPDGLADSQGVRPYGAVTCIAGKRLVDIYDWETVPYATLDAEGRYGAHRVSFENPSGREIGVDFRSIPINDLNGSSEEILPTRCGLHDWGFPDALPGVDTLDDVLGIEVGGPSELLRDAPADDVRLACLHAGEPIAVLVPAGTKPGVTVEGTAYPLVLSPRNRLDVTVRRSLRLMAGSYLALVRAPGHVEFCRPFIVGPANDGIARITLPPTDPPEGFVYVDGGRFQYQRDPDVGIPDDASAGETSPFFIAKDETSMGEWLEFLNESSQIVGLENRARLDHWVPRRDSGQWAHLSCDGRWTFPRGTCAESPVAGVKDDDIPAFIAWKNERARRSGSRWQYRLPTPQEWEKAARGVDGRRFVWGDHFDFALANGFPSRWRSSGGVLCLEPRGRFLTDESPYGVRDMTGGVAEWNDGKVTPFSSWTPRRGGSWVQTITTTFRAASRDANKTDMPDRGFRLVAEPVPVEKR